MEAGTGDPLLFLHGWGLTPRAYAEGVVRLCAAGIRVIAPSLPGFGGSDGPPLRNIELGAYAERVAAAVEALGLSKPAFVVGHSFGGGVALRLASDRPDLVRSLTLVNSVGGAPGRRGLMSRHSWLVWALGALTELHPAELGRLAPLIARDLVPNLARRPVTLTLSALLALRASLAEEAAALVRDGMPVLFLWGDRDRLVTPGALRDVASHLPPEVVSGGHGWLLSSPEEFADLLRNALTVHAMLERRRRGQAVVLPPGATLADLFPPERRERSRLPGAGAHERGSDAS